MMTGSFEIAAGGVSGAEHAYWGGKQNDAWHAPNVIPIAKRQMATFQHAASIIRERSRVATTPQPVSAPATQVASVPERLKELASLRDAGIVTEEEFSKKKAELLERL
jgi:hypothetical protein